MKSGNNDGRVVIYVIAGVAAVVIGVAVELVAVCLLRRARHISSLGLLENVDTSALKVLRTSRWPGKNSRWPGPASHKAEFISTEKLGYYALLADERGEKARLGAELGLLAAGAAWGSTITPDLSAFVSAVHGSWNSPGHPTPPSYLLVQVGWRTIAVLVVVILMIRIRDHGVWLRELAANYREICRQRPPRREGQQPSSLLIEGRLTVEFRQTDSSKLQVYRDSTL